MSDSPTKANTIAKALFIVGGAILFILLLIFILRLVPVAISNISNIGTSLKSSITGVFGTDEQIKLTTNTDTLSSGSPLIINFEYKPEQDGQYFVSYTCSEGLFYDIQSLNGAKRIICNSPFKLGSNISAISIVPVVTKANIFIDSTLTIEYKDLQGNPIAKGTKLVTIKNEGNEVSNATSTQDNPFDIHTSSTSTPSVTSKPVTNKPANTKPQTSKPSQTHTTYVTPTRDLTLTQIFPLEDKSTFIFYVYNYGNTAIPTWNFSYTDAQNPSQTILSAPQSALGAGQGLALIVKFDGQQNSNQTVFVTLDPYNQIPETSVSNNSASVVISGDRTNSNSGNDSYNSGDRADLTIDEFLIGRKSGSRIDERNEIDTDDTAVISFVVKNKGGEATGSWRFELTDLPYDNDDSYESKSYTSLKPGESIEVVLEFEGVDYGNYNIELKIDSTNDVREESERNNSDSRSLRVRR